MALKRLSETLTKAGQPEKGGPLETPRGAHPCSCDLRYDYDLDFIDRYYEASRSDEGFSRFLDRYVREVPDHAAYLEQVGIRPGAGA